MVDRSRIILVRHGETRWNQQQKIQGHKNSPLTATGKKQAQRVRQSLASEVIDAAYVSPLQRAVDTMEIILDGRSVDIISSDNLKEISLGPWEGKTRQSTRLSHPLEYEDFWHRPERFALLGAETYQQLQQRMVAQIKSIFCSHPNQSILVVTHWIAIKTVLAYFTSTPLSQLCAMPDLNNGDSVTLIQQGEHISVHACMR